MRKNNIILLMSLFFVFLFLLPDVSIAETLIFHRDDNLITDSKFEETSSLFSADSSAGLGSTFSLPISLTFSFVGDCTLGGTEKMLRYDSGFVAFMEGQPYTYPFLYLLPFFNQDDLTLVNLEGVLSDSSRGENKEKTYAFRGPSDYASILSQSGIEAVNLSNNHTGDYGKRGIADTLAALDEEEVAYSGEGWLNVFSLKGINVGLAGTRSNWNQEVRANLKKEIALLKQQGCDIIIYSMHAGQEYSYAHNKRQQTIAHFLIENGADIVIGHHPHVVQGVEQYLDGYIFYSLGNCAFGGNHRPRDLNALLSQVTFTIDSASNHKTITPSLLPIHISGTHPQNNYQPVLITGEDAAKVLKIVEKDSNISLPSFIEGKGALLPSIEKPLS